MAREYFLTYHDNLSALKLLSDSERGRLYLTLLEYSAKDENPKYENPVLNGNEKFLFEIIKTQIDREKDKYKKQCEANKENGKFGILGGRPRKNTERKPSRVLKTPKEDKEKEEYEDKYEEEEKYKDKYKNKKKESIATAIQKKKLGEFENVLLTEQEFEKLNSDYGAELPGIIEHLSAYIEMKGYKAKSHYLAIKKWVALAYQEQKLRESSFENRKNQNYGGTANGAIKPVCTKYSDGDEF